MIKITFSVLELFRRHCKTAWWSTDHLDLQKCLSYRPGGTQIRWRNKRDMKWAVVVDLSILTTQIHSRTKLRLFSRNKSDISYLKSNWPSNILIHSRALLPSAHHWWWQGKFDAKRELYPMTRSPRLFPSVFAYCKQAIKDQRWEWPGNKFSPEEVAGLHCRNSGGGVTKAHDGFRLVGKVLIVDSWSALVAYLKCHYFLSCCSWRLRNLEGLGL